MLEGDETCNSGLNLRSRFSFREGLTDHYSHMPARTAAGREQFPKHTKQSVTPKAKVEVLRFFLQYRSSRNVNKQLNNTQNSLKCKETAET